MSEQIQTPAPTPYQALRRAALEHYFGRMNASQRRAVFHMDGPLLILAGAGSGKTTVLIGRIENMILFGDAYIAPDPAEPAFPGDLDRLEDYVQGGGLDPQELSSIIGHRTVRPWNILAITFTNKAAGELRDRLQNKLGPAMAADVWASTFHSLCVRILRREGEHLGYGKAFTIYDADDSLRVIKASIKSVGLDDKMFPPKSVMGAISRAKDKLLNAAGYAAAARQEGDLRLQSIAKVYAQYEKELKSANAMDFDDLIMQTVFLFESHPAILAAYQDRWRYVMVDEYQDTNHAQFKLVNLLAGGHKNLCVVGDDDQSIYKFRGADVANILGFDEVYPGVEVIRLEQNYRSTSNILNAANQVIANNSLRRGKNLWTDIGEGDKVRVERVRDEEEESRLIADAVLENVKDGAKFADHAVLYRMNAQSGTVEQALAKNGIPYRIIGGVRFYERKEIKDMVAYLTVLNNRSDNLRLARILNEPKRNLGNTTLAAAQEIAATVGMSLYDTLADCEQFAQLNRKKAAIEPFIKMMEDLAAFAEENPLDLLLEEILTRTGYRAMLESQGLEGAGRMENILELKSNLIRYGQENPEPSLNGFLEEIALYTDLDNYDPQADSMVLMTIHAAKGLEFDTVFIAGMDEGIFPGRNSFAFPEEIEEERRLAYVAITRAKRKLLITSAQRRLIFGQTIYSQPSRFIAELPKDCAELNDRTATRRQTAANAYAAAVTQRRSDASTSIGVGSAKSGTAAASGEQFAPGERVVHKTFGQGTVSSAKPMGGDTLLEIDFDTAGTKKIMANFARLVKA